MNRINYLAYPSESGDMCLILDTNRFSDFLNPDNQDMEPVRKWMNRKNGKFAFASTVKMERELRRHNKMRLQFDVYREKGQIKLSDPDDVEKEKAKLPRIKSDDEDIIALALVSKVKLLVTDEKDDLPADFKQIVKGKVYKRKQHHRLLQKDICP